MHRVGDDVGNHVDRPHGLHPHFAGGFAREKNLPKLRIRKPQPGVDVGNLTFILHRFARLKCMRIFHTILHHYKNINIVHCRHPVGGTRTGLVQ